MFARATDGPGQFGASRSIVCASRGIVATSQPLAAYEAVRVLDDGGNAIDAAVTAALVLSVTEPMQIGLGGDVLALIYDAQNQKLLGLNSSGCAPASVSLDAIQERLGKDQPHMVPHSIFSVTVPGAVDGWLALLERFGRLDRQRIFEPAIRAAEDGFAVAPQTAVTWGLGAPILARQRASKETWLKPDGAPFGAGERFRNPKLAASLRLVAKFGRDAMYGGPLGEAIIRTSHEENGFLELSDFEAHKVEWVEPAEANYRNHTLAELPPNAQGVAVLEALSILEHFDLGSLGYGSVEAAHIQIEAAKHGLADAATHVTDTDQLKVVPEWFLDAERIKGLSQNILSRSDTHPTSGLPNGGDTAFVCAADDDGNAISLIGSLFLPWASGLTAGDAGFLLQNRGFGFSLDPAHVNVIAPSKKTRHTILPAMLLKEDRPVMAFGFVGGDMQVQGQVQFLSNLLDFGMDPQNALDAPRWRIDDNLQDIGLEPGLSSKAGGGLVERGHTLVGSDGFFGGGQAVLLHPEHGTLQGVSDGRRDGCALGH